MTEEKLNTVYETEDEVDLDCRYTIVYGANGPRVDHPANGCRRYECCGGRDCGYTLEEAKQQLKDYYLQVIERIDALDAQSIWLFRP